MLLLRRARELEHQLPGAIEGDDESVHQTRVASRRLREALPVLAPPSKLRRAARRNIRRLTRALGDVREMDVALGILDEVARRPGIPRDALEDVRAHVMAERERRRARMGRRLGRINPVRLNRRLGELSGALDDVDMHDWRETLARRITRRATRLEATIEAAGRMYAPERLHDVRIAAKKLRYTLELAADARFGRARPLVGTLKRAQDTLGRLHDLQVLQQHVAAVQAAPPVREGAEDGGLDVIAGVLEEECRHLHARYSKHLPSLVELVTACRSGLFLLATPARHRRPLKMLRPGASRPLAVKRA